MFYEIRTYVMVPYKLPDWLDLYKTEALPVQLQYLGKLIGFFTTEVGTLNQITHIWAYESLDDRIERRTKMAADSRWTEFCRKSKELGAVMQMESRITRPTDFSPLQ